MEQRFCQSCGMPLTGADGADYCAYCWRDGAFVWDCTMEEMIAFCAPIVHREHPEVSEQEAAAQMRAFFPTLKRWRGEEPH